MPFVVVVDARKDSAGQVFGKGHGRIVRDEVVKTVINRRRQDAAEADGLRDWPGLQCQADGRIRHKGHCDCVLRR